MSAVTRIVRVACGMWIPLVALALTLTATTWPRPRSAAIVGRVVTARLADIPSHNRLYVASLDLTSDSVWFLRLRSASGAPIPNARLTIDGWMPEQERVAHSAPTATQYASDGDYRVTPLALDRPGWWNVSVQISAAGRADSLAFNLILR
jgi:hypothetical protein